MRRSSMYSLGLNLLGLFSLGLLTCPPTLAPAQTPVPAAAQQSNPSLAPRPANETSAPAVEDSMRLDVVVTDKSGKNVPGLGVGDFQLFDNGRPMQISSFKAFGGSASTDPPPESVIIIFDTVNMPFESVSYTREQVGAFLRQNGGHLAYPVSLAFLTNTGMQVQSSGVTDGNELAKHLDDTAGSLRTIGNAAGSWGAIERFDFCVKMMGTLVESLKDQPGRKLVIWAGPGWPLLSDPGINFSMKGQKQFFDSVVALNTMLREEQIELSSVAQGMPGEGTYLYESYLKGVKKMTQAMPPNLALKVIATQSGGRVIPPTNDVAAAIESVVQDAGTFYEVTFEPPKPDGPNEYHELKLKVNQPGLTAHTNTGYYGQVQKVSTP
jgi:VWFA-related protein